MIFYPAIDLKDGECVRLLRGDMEAATVYNQNPAGQAKSFEALGSQWLHIVDLNGAILGHPVNAIVIKEILKSVSIPIELGGGIRNRKTVEMWLENGIARIILGTAAVQDPSFIREVCRAYPGQVAIGIDAKDGKVAVEGWIKRTQVNAIDLALKYENTGAAALIYTDIARDGAMQGPNIDTTLAIAEAVKIPVILSGGISSMDDLRLVKKSSGTLLDGLIIGRAIYDGRIDVLEAIKYLAMDSC